MQLAEMRKVAAPTDFASHMSPAPSQPQYNIGIWLGTSTAEALRGTAWGKPATTCISEAGQATSSARHHQCGQLAVFLSCCGAYSSIAATPVGQRAGANSVNWSRDSGTGAWRRQYVTRQGTMVNFSPQCERGCSLLVGRGRTETRQTEEATLRCAGRMVSTTPPAVI